MRKISIWSVLVILTFLITTLTPLTQTSAKSQNLLSDVSTVWVNGIATIIVTTASKTEPELTVSAKAKKAVNIKVGNWENGQCRITLTSKKTQKTTLTINGGGDTLKLPLYSRKPQTMSGEDVYKYLKPSIVEIQSKDYMGNIYVGTGFFIEDCKLLTTYHVVDSAQSIEVTGLSGEEYQLKRIIKLDEENDLILFETDTSGQALSLSGSRAGGERVYSIGNPSGMTGTFIEGILSNDGVVYKKRNHLQISMPVSSGMGGAPVVNEKGQVLGVVDLIVSNAQNLGMSIPAEDISTFAETTTPVDGLTMEQFFATTEHKTKKSNYSNLLANTSDRSAAGELETPAEKTGTQIYQDARDAMVTIEVSSGLTPEQGSGFFISEDTIVTCWHVVGSAAPNVTVTDYNGNTYRLKTINGNPANDTAVLTIYKTDNDHGCLTVNPGYIPPPGERLYGLGTPRGFADSFSQGITSVPQCYIEGITYIGSSVPIAGGSSGGPLFNKYGQVIGINAATVSLSQNASLSIPIGAVSIH